MQYCTKRQGGHWITDVLSRGVCSKPGPHIFKSLQFIQMENMILSFLQSWATHFQINPSVLPAEKCVNLQSRGRTMVERNCVEKAVNTLVRDLLRLLALWVFLGGIFGANNIQKQPKTSKKHPKTINGSTEYIIYCVYIYIELAWWIYSSFSPFLTRPS